LINELVLPQSLALVFEPFWFNSDGYCHSQHGAGHTTLWTRQGEDEIFVRFFEQEGWWQSPFRAPFGGAEFSEATTEATLVLFWEAICEKAREKGLKGISVVAPPECYDSKIQRQHQALLQAGFEIQTTELNYHLPVEHEFKSFLHTSEKRRLQKCEKAGFTYGPEYATDYREIHRLIAACRLRKGFPLSMNEVDFENMFARFPDRYVVFTVRDQGTLIAAAVGVKVRSDILYNFLPGDHPDYLSYSPVVMLNGGMYEYCRQYGIGIYDLGIATAGGVRNEGLIRFKEHLGGQCTPKYSYQIRFE
jgi:hypothetical protein